MRAVIYARYSSSSQREESIEGQVKECAAYAERNGYTIIKTYADRAISCTTDNRPQFQKMIDFLRNIDTQYFVISHQENENVIPKEKLIAELTVYFSH